MGNGANQYYTARGEGTVRFAKAFEPVTKEFLQLPKFTVLHPYDDGAVAVVCRGEDGRKGLIRQKDDYWLTLPNAISK